MSELPDTLKPYDALGVELRVEDEQAVGDCPWCTREGRFSVHIETGMWRCLVCNEGSENGKPIKGGNVTTFVRMLHERSAEATRVEQLEELAKDRHIGAETLRTWGVCVSSLNGELLIPGYSPDGKMRTLYRYTFLEGRNRKVLLPTPTLKHHLIGMNLWKPKHEVIYICEGIWDAAALWETLAAAKFDESGERIVMTSNPKASLLTVSNVIAIPSATTFAKGWVNLFGGKVVNLMEHSDHPTFNKVTKQTSPPAGFTGAGRIASALAKADKPPKAMNFLNWGEDGFDPEKKSGYDVRDLLTERI